LSLVAHEIFFVLISDGDYNAIRRSADVAIFLSEGVENSCGIAWLNYIDSGRTLGVVARSCASSQFSFGHEIGHMYGCYHNMEKSGQNPYYPNAHGYLMRPPLNSGYRTFMA